MGNVFQNASSSGIGKMIRAEAIARMTSVDRSDVRLGDLALTTPNYVGHWGFKVENCYNRQAAGIIVSGSGSGSEDVAWYAALGLGGKIRGEVVVRTGDAASAYLAWDGQQIGQIATPRQREWVIQMGSTPWGTVSTARVTSEAMVIQSGTKNCWTVPLSLKSSFGDFARACLCIVSLGIYRPVSENMDNRMIIPRNDENPSENELHLLIVASIPLRMYWHKFDSMSG